MNDPDSDFDPWLCKWCRAGPFSYDVGPGGWDEHWVSCDKIPRPVDERRRSMGRVVAVEPRSRRARVLGFLGCAIPAVLFWYAMVAFVVFAFRHPELTDTQRVLRIWDALCWR